MTDPRNEPETELPLETERALELALRSAWKPAKLDPARHEALLALCLEDPLAEPTPEELRESEELRLALEGNGEHPDALLAQALRAGYAPSEPKAPPELSKELTAAPPSRGRVIYVAFGAATTLLAAAAAVALVVGSFTRKHEERLSQVQSSEGAPAAAMEVDALGRTSQALSRSSASLFHEPFTLEQTTARVDRIASARERELRSNLYASWGLK